MPLLEQHVSLGVVGSFSRGEKTVLYLNSSLHSYCKVVKKYN